MIPRDMVQLRTLDPAARASALEIWAECDALLDGTGYCLSLAGPSSCLRTFEEQAALWAIGRRLVDGQWMLDPAQGPIVTKCDGVRHKSRHQSGRAVDCGIREVAPALGMGRFWYDEPDSPSRARGLFCQVVGAFVKHGWRWGGEWKSFPDRNHFELPAPKPAKGGPA